MPRENQITVLAKNQLFHVKGKKEFSVAFMPGVVAVYGFGIGKQYFKNPTNAKPEDIKEVFPDEDAIEEAASLHRIGTVNRKKLERSLERLVSAGKLTPPRRNQILTEVLDCDCTPAGLRRRLYHMGFSDVLSMPGFEMEDRKKELKDTVEALQIFIEEYHEYLSM